MPKDGTELLNRIPHLDGYAPVVTGEENQNQGQKGKFTGPEPDQAHLLFDEILEGGPDLVTAVIDQLAEIDDGTDYRARYTLHGMTTYLCDPEKAEIRERFNKTLAGALEGDRPKSVKGYLIRQLQLSGDGANVKALSPYLLDEELSEYAALALLAIRDGAASAFRETLPKAEGPMKLTAVQALGILKDKPSAPALRKIAKHAEGDLQTTALWALSNMGEPV